MTDLNKTKFTYGDVYQADKQDNKSLWIAGINAEHSEKYTHFNAIEMYASTESEVIALREFVSTKLIAGVNMKTATWLVELTNNINRNINSNISNHNVQRALYAFSNKQYGKGRRILGEEEFTALQEILTLGLKSNTF